MSEMVERVTQAFLDAIPGGTYVDDDWPDGEVIIDGTFNVSMAIRAAIVAMREPTEAMLRACPVVGTGPDEAGNWAVNTKPAQVMWPAMIDAALK